MFNYPRCLIGRTKTQITKTFNFDSLLKSYYINTFIHKPCTIIHVLWFITWNQVESFKLMWAHFFFLPRTRRTRDGPVRSRPPAKRFCSSRKPWSGRRQPGVPMGFPLGVPMPKTRWLQLGNPQQTMGKLWEKCGTSPKYGGLVRFICWYYRLHYVAGKIIETQDVQVFARWSEIFD